MQVETYAQGLKVEHPFARGRRSLDGVEDMLRVFDIFKFDQGIILALGNQNLLPAILAEAQDKQALLDFLNTGFRLALSCAVHVDLLRRFGVPCHCLWGKEGGKVNIFLTSTDCQSAHGHALHAKCILKKMMLP
jgi:hypothetical protein